MTATTDLRTGSPHVAPPIDDGVDYIAFDRMRATYRALVREAIAAVDGARVGDVGGGVSPLVTPDEVRDNGLTCTVIDVSAEETAALDRDVYRVVTGDAADPGLLAAEPGLLRSFDVTFSKMVAEHVPDGGRYHRNLFEMTAPGGVAIHMFPTLYAVPFLVNKAVPESVAGVLLDAFDSRPQSKFPAHYSWCKGPSPRQLDRIRAIGWEIDRYLGVMGHSYYRRIPVVRAVHRALGRVALRAPRPWLTSYAVVKLRRPA